MTSDSPSVQNITDALLSSVGLSHRDLSLLDNSVVDPVASTLPTICWEPIGSSIVDQGPLFLSCATFDPKSRNFYGISSLEKNRFCELVRFDIGTCRWAGCTRTRHFRPPKRIGSAAVSVRGMIFIFGGYELSNHLERKHGSPGSQRERHSPESLNGFAHRSLLMSVFGYPRWWIDPTATKVQKGSGSMLGRPLGDFHTYDCSRGEWNVIISRDQVPVRAPLEELQTVHHSGGTRRKGSGPDWFGDNHLMRPRTAIISSGNSPGDPLPPSRAFHTMVKPTPQSLVLFGGEGPRSQHDLCDVPFREIEYFNDLWICDLHNMRWTQIEPQSPFHKSGDRAFVKRLLSLPESLSSANVEPRDPSASLEKTSDYLPEFPGFGDDVLRQSIFNAFPGNLGAPPLDLSTLGLEPEARSGHTAVCYQGSMFVFGGKNADQTFGDLWALDLKTYSWNRLLTSGKQPMARCGHSATIIGSNMCIYGGLTTEDIDMMRNSAGDNSKVSFSDNNALYLLNFETLVWTELQITGTPPQDSRLFGRVYSFFWNGSLWCGGPTGRDTFSSFEFMRVNLTSALHLIRSTTSSATLASASLSRTTTSNSAVRDSCFTPLDSWETCRYKNTHCKRSLNTRWPPPVRTSRGKKDTSDFQRSFSNLFDVLPSASTAASGHVATTSESYALSLPSFTNSEAMLLQQTTGPCNTETHAGSPSSFTREASQQLQSATTAIFNNAFANHFRPTPSSMLHTDLSQSQLNHCLPRDLQFNCDTHREKQPSPLLEPVQHPPSDIPPSVETCGSQMGEMPGWKTQAQLYQSRLPPTTYSPPNEFIPGKPFSRWVPPATTATISSTLNQTPGSRLKTDTCGADIAMENLLNFPGTFAAATRLLAAAAEPLNFRDSPSTHTASERILLDLSCITKLQHEASAAWEENQLLKETLLAMVPHLNLPELVASGQLDPEKVAQVILQSSKTNPSHQAILQSILTTQQRHQPRCPPHIPRFTQAPSPAFPRNPDHSP